MDDSNESLFAEGLDQLPGENPRKDRVQCLADSHFDRIILFIEKKIVVKERFRIHTIIHRSHPYTLKLFAV